MKPIVRWTISNVSKKGFDCLSLSINSFYKLYGNEFKYMIFHNDIQHKDLNPYVEYLDQELYKKTFFINPKGPAWKLYPPVYDNSCKEIIIDNDLIIYKKLPAIDIFLRENIPFITEGYERNFGFFDNYVKDNFKLNSGFVCIPSNYNYKEKLNEIILKSSISEWTTHFDEQGLVASVISKDKFNIISNKDIHIALNEMKLGNYGIHFVGLNSGYDKYWNQYLVNKTL